MTFSLINHSAGNAASNAVTNAVDTTGANLITVSISAFGAVTPTVSDNKGNTWGAAIVSDTTNQDIFLYALANPNTGSGHTFTATGASTFSTIIATAWAGAGGLPVDQTNHASATSTSIQPGSITPTLNNELIITAGAFGNAASAFAINGGFTISDSIVGNPGTSVGSAQAYLIQTTAAAVNPTWSWTGSDEAEVLIASFKVALPASPGVSGFIRFGPFLTMELITLGAGAKLASMIRKNAVSSRRRLLMPWK